MSSHLGLNETLALLDRLRSAIQDFAAREEKLAGEFRVRSAAEAKAFESATQEQASRLSVAIAGAGAHSKLKRANGAPKLKGGSHGSPRPISLSQNRSGRESADAKGAENKRYRKARPRLNATVKRDWQTPLRPWRTSKPDWLKVAGLSACWRKRPEAPFAATANFAGCFLPTGNGRNPTRPRTNINCWGNFTACRRPFAAIWTISKNFRCRDFSGFSRCGCS